MQPEAPLKIFIIYAHEDRTFKEDLLKRLKLLRSQGLIQPWHDRDLAPGDDWDKIIRGHLAVADIILPIISIDFFNSDYIEKVEIVEAFERFEQGHAHIVPIIARQCRWEDDPRIARLQALPENGLPIAKWPSADDAFDSVYDGIKAKILEIQKGRKAKAETTVKKAEDQPKPKRSLSERLDMLVAEGILNIEDEKQPPGTDPFADLMIHIKGGTFDMGNTFGDGTDAEKPVHKVTLSDFYLCKYPVTQGQWKAIMGSDLAWLEGEDTLPMESISWDEAQHFIKELNRKTGKTYRLPTEAEWEYAARGGSQSKGYKFAGSNDLTEVGWYKDNSGSKTHPVGQKKANELGLYDMSGNLYEWCQDRYGGYSKNAQVNPQGPSWGAIRVVRGGAWGSNPLYCHVAYRFNREPAGRYVGFRLVLSLKSVG